MNEEIQILTNEVAELKAELRRARVYADRNRELRDLLMSQARGHAEHIAALTRHMGEK